MYNMHVPQTFLFFFHMSEVLHYLPELTAVDTLQITALGLNGVFSD